MGNTTYDPSIIERFADSLYAQAKTVVIVYAGVGATVGLIVGIAATQPLGGSAMAVVGFMAPFGLVLGIAAGRTRAFALRLQAQMALCQVHLERNTARGYGVRSG